MKQNSPYRYALIGLFCLASLSLADSYAEETNQPTEEKPIPKTPWAFNLSSYLWTAGLKGDFTAGSHSGSVDTSFIDIWGKSRRPPLGFMGRLEIHNERFAFYVDGNYMNIQLKPAFGRISQGIGSELGLMDYGLMYRIFGAPASERTHQVGKIRSNVVDVYAGARTLWMGNSVTFSGPFGLAQRSPSTNRSFTTPVIGGRFSVDFTSNLFVLADVNFGGFGVDNVDFTGGLMGMLGYRTDLFGVPTSLEAGYRAIRYNVDPHGPAAANATLNGPFIGLTGYW